MARSIYLQVLAEITVRPCYNIAPSTYNPVLLAGPEGSRMIQTMRWGIDSPFKDSKQLVINARAESLNQSPMWSPLLRHGRCVVLSSGFYEWRVEGKKRIPFYITLQKGFMAHAALHSNNTFALITTASRRYQNCSDLSSDIAQIHERMPVLLDTLQAVNDWLFGSEQAQLALLQNAPDQFSFVQVSPLINNVRIDR